jgi:hypothetical protein
MILDLTDKQNLVLAAINEDRYPLSPRVQTLKALREARSAGAHR